MKYDDRIGTNDYRVIAKMTGYDYTTVRDVVYGRRNNPKILEALEALLESREKLIQEFPKVKKWTRQTPAE